MKKKIVVVLLMVIVGVFIFYNDNKHEWYYFADNENGFYDEIYEQYASLPSYETLPPSKDKLKALENMDNVEGVYPFFYVTNLPDEEDGDNKVTEVEVCANGKKYTVEFPKVVEIDEEEKTVIQGISARTYATQEIYFESNTLALSMLGTDSGVFIPQHFYKALEVPEGTTSLQLTVTLQIPVTSKIESVHYTPPVDEYGISYYDDEYDFYADAMIQNRYQEITYTFDIQGVTTSYGTSLNIPPDIAEDLLNQLDKTNISLQEDELFWEPLTYMIVLKEKQSLNSLGKDIDELIDKFIINVPSTDEIKRY